VLVWVRSSIEPDLFDHNVPFDNTTPIYLISLPWKLGLGLGLDLSCAVLGRLALFTENKENEHLFSANFTEGNIVKKRNHSINSKMIYIFYECVSINSATSLANKIDVLMASEVRLPVCHQLSCILSRVRHDDHT